MSFTTTSFEELRWPFLESTIGRGSDATSKVQSVVEEFRFANCAVAPSMLSNSALVALPLDGGADHEVSCNTASPEAMVSNGDFDRFISSKPT